MTAGELSCVALGGGGHALVIIESIHLSQAATVVAVLDPKESTWGEDLAGVPIMGGDDLLGELAGDTVNCFVVGLGSVGNSKPRERLFKLGLSHDLIPLTVVHPRAICSSWAVLGHGAQLLPGSIVNPGAKLGDNVIINSGAIVEHHCTVGNHTHIATGAHLSGSVTVGAGAHIGVGSSIRQGITVGDRAVVGAGAVVVKDVSPGDTVVGVPAQPIQKTT